MRRALVAAIAASVLLATPAVAHQGCHECSTWPEYRAHYLTKNEAPTDKHLATNATALVSDAWDAWKKADAAWDLAHQPAPSAVTTYSSTIKVAAYVPTGDIQELICSYDWECSIALGVSSCESGFNPTADNPSSSAYGLFQRLGETSSDPAVQVANAYAMYQARYWQPWGWPDGAWGCYW